MITNEKLQKLYDKAQMLGVVVYDVDAPPGTRTQKLTTLMRTVWRRRVNKTSKIQVFYDIPPEMVTDTFIKGQTTLILAHNRDTDEVMLGTY